MHESFGIVVPWFKIFFDNPLSFAESLIGEFLIAHSAVLLATLPGSVLCFSQHHKGQRRAQRKPENCLGDVRHCLSTQIQFRHAMRRTGTETYP
jgi:hypothetical protein